MSAGTIVGESSVRVEVAAPGAHEARIAAGSLAAGVYAVVLSVEGAERQRRVRRLTVVR